MHKFDRKIGINSYKSKFCTDGGAEFVNKPH